MRAKLLIIDPQNDFCDMQGAALPVAGADADMRRLGAFMSTARERLQDIILTLDTHSSVAIERPAFWENEQGGPIAPFTEITEAEVRQGKYRPRDPELLPAVLGYLYELEGRGRYRLMIWPAHCVLGTWGHNMHTSISDEVAAWEALFGRGAKKILKGMNPLTEQYSALRAEVPNDDPRTRLNSELLAAASPASGPVLVAGEASSHCVKATMEDLYEATPARFHTNIVLLKDCMSSVAGFEAAGQAFLRDSAARGVRVMTHAEALELLK